MSQTDPGCPPSLLHAAGHVGLVRDAANQAWAAMRKHDILPTPQNFELWHAHFSGGSPALSARLSSLLDAGAGVTPAQLSALHVECFARDLDIDAVAESSEQLDKAAQAMVEHVAGNTEALRAYGDALSSMEARLGALSALDGLVGAVATLTAETARASERNHALEQQLAASALRITRLRRSLAEAKQHATTDGLTGLCNRKTFDFRLRRAASRAKATGEALTLLLLDIDHFKQFNDVYGHRTGDLVLRLVARVVADNIKGRDTAARFGGEEFAVILSGADLRAGVVVAGQMRAVLDGKRLVTRTGQQDRSNVTISVGVAQMRPDDNAVSLLERADAALYLAKHQGRNRVCAEGQLSGSLTPVPVI